MSLLVAVTRPERQARGTARALTARGHRPLLVPLLREEPRGTLPDPSTVGSLVLTSRSAARRLADAPALADTHIFAVGDATAAEARRAGARSVTSASGTVDDLFDLIANSVREPTAHAGAREPIAHERAREPIAQERAREPIAQERAREPIVHLSGEDHRGDLVERLRAAGLEARRSVIYAMVAASALPPLGEVPDGLLLFSPRTATIFAGLCAAAPDPWARLPVLALSEAVAASLSPRPGPVHVAPAPTEASLLDALDGLAGELTAAAGQAMHG